MHLFDPAHRFRVTLLLIVSLLLMSWLAGCGGGLTVRPGASGIRGVATETLIPGTIPAPLMPTPAPVTKSYAGAVITVKPVGGGEEIARRTADADGQFQIILPAGTYLLVPLRPADSAGLPTAPVQTVTVNPSQFSEVEVKYVAPLP